MEDIRLGWLEFDHGQPQDGAAIVFAVSCLQLFSVLRLWIRREGLSQTPVKLLSRPEPGCDDCDDYDFYYSW